MRWVFTAAVLTVVALVAGMNVFGGPFDVFGMYGLALLINLAGVLWAGGVAMRFRTMQAGPVMQMPVFLILFFAPVYVPLGAPDRLDRGGPPPPPGPLAPALNPLTYVLEGAEAEAALGLLQHGRCRIFGDPRTRRSQGPARARSPSSCSNPS